jgi:hypothetical protein
MKRRSGEEAHQRAEVKEMHDKSSGECWRDQDIVSNGSGRRKNLTQRREGAKKS